MTLPGDKDPARELDQHANPHPSLWDLVLEAWHEADGRSFDHPARHYLDGCLDAMAAATGRPRSVIDEQLAARLNR